MSSCRSAGLTIHALDRIDVQRLAQARDIAVRVVSIYRAVDDDPAGPAQARCSRNCGTRRASPRELSPDAAGRRSGRMELPFGQRLLRVNLNLVPLLGVPHWRELRILPDRTGTVG